MGCHIATPSQLLKVHSSPRSPVPSIRCHGQVPTPWLLRCRCLSGNVDVCVCVCVCVFVCDRRHRQVPHIRDAKTAKCQVDDDRRQGQQSELGTRLHVVSIYAYRCCIFVNGRPLRAGCGTSATLQGAYQ